MSKSTNNLKTCLLTVGIFWNPCDHSDQRHLAGFFNDPDFETQNFQDSEIRDLEIRDLRQNYGRTPFLTRSKSRTFEGA